jgi:hypothetical protein
LLLLSDEAVVVALGHGQPIQIAGQNKIPAGENLLAGILFLL